MPQNNADERRSARSKVFLTATVEAAIGSTRVRIEDLSAHGARVSGDDLPEVDTPVAFQCNGVRVEGYIAWVAPPLAGIGFGEPIEPSEALRRIASPRPSVTQDFRGPNFRRPGFRSRPLTAAEQRLIADWNENRANRLGE